jgi:hypothetical protein
MVTQALLDPKEQQVQMVTQEQLDLKVHQVHKERLDPKVQRV